ncbi:hypothetical protein PV11_00827 [Exophiala sideris]|uniref:MOSC domain-containing protein n=1 Tax=Exophiala sideris TaxID=1016849 RepID=A0A0D1YQR6_9EURO|nr:hypothetical protein PV11_00827 [Exophiala sideris]
MSTPSANKMRVTQIYTYPIKSLRGISLSSLPAMYTGFPHDRRFMLFKVDEGKNMHVSDKTEMCLFTTAFAEPEGTTPKTVVVSYSLEHTFNKPERRVNKDTLEVPLSPDVEALSLEEVPITMHGSPCVGFNMGERYNAWFSDRFGYPVKLLYIGNNKRQVLGNMPPAVAARQRDGLTETNGNANRGSSWLSSLTSTATSLVGAVMGPGENKENEYDGVDEGISFADVAPYLVVSSKSWEDAQRRLPEGEIMDISKFRPNIIVEGAEEEYDEDYWAELMIGDGAKIILTQNCARCNSLNVDYSTGKVGVGEAGKILKKLNKDRRVDPGTKWSPVFGRYGFLARVPEGKNAAEIKVGDEVRVLRRNSERTKFEWPDLSTN